MGHDQSRESHEYQILIPRNNSLKHHFRLDSGAHLQIYDHKAAAQDSFTNNIFRCAFSGQSMIRGLPTTPFINLAEGISARNKRSFVRSEPSSTVQDALAIRVHSMHRQRGLTFNDLLPFLQPFFLAPQTLWRALTASSANTKFLNC